VEYLPFDYRNSNMLYNVNTHSSYARIAGCAVEQPCANSHWLSQWEPFIFDPLTESTFLNLSLKTVTGDYVHDLYSYAKFGVNPSMGGFCASR